MDRRTRRGPIFGMLAVIARACMGVALGLAPSCGLDDGTVTQAVGTDEAASAADGDDAVGAVCTKGLYRCHAKVRGGSNRGFRPHADVPTGYGATDLQAAYKVTTDKIASPKPTVAIVDAYGYPALEQDLIVYRAYYRLPPCTIANGCLKVVNQRGETSPLPAPPPPDDDWTIETALDLDMASAACPLCNLLVVQAEDNGVGLILAQNVAVALGATVISNSWGGPESVDTTPQQLAATEAYFAHPGTAIFVSAGDNGYNDNGEGPDYPATSAGVIAVGGTKLVRDPTTARGWSETAWTQGGSACSLAVAKPAYQTASPCAFKATTDIAAAGDPNPGLAVYNAANSGWISVGGTSASAPFVAAVFAATGNGAQSSGAFIASKASKLYDVTTGRNGECASEGNLLCNAAAGWDGPTGYGTPNATALISFVAPPTTDEPATAGDGNLTGGCATGGHAGAGGLLGLALLALRRGRRAAR